MPYFAARTVRGSLAAALAAAAIACGSSGKDRTYGEELPAQPEPSGPIGGSSGTLGNAKPDSGAPTGDNQCAAESTTAKGAQVDIIVVIDTSGSMDEETAQVKANINTFASKIGSSGLDYTVVMLAGKPVALPIPGFTLPGVCVPPPLGGANCGDNAPKFHHIDQTIGSTDALALILSKFSAYEPFLRPAATKVFIQVTDDNSTDLAFAAFDQQLLAKSPAQFGTAANRRYVFDSICGWKKGTPVLDAQACGTAVNTGDQYQHLSQLTGGIVDSVCEADYSGVFDNIAKGLVKKLGCEFSFPKSTTGAQTDPTRVAVNYTPGMGAKKTLTQVTDASKCASIADAWYYDDNTNPTRILFCPTTCTAVGADTNGKLEVAVGCKGAPPK